MISRPRIAALDTNLLLLLLVGQTDLSLLETFKRVNTFSPADLHALLAILQPFEHVITTPHVLSEASNFIDQAPLYRRKVLIAALRRFALAHREQYEAASVLVVRREFDFLGPTDTALTSLGSQAVSITIDQVLAREVALLHGHAINFNHIRGQRFLEN